jgi:hypothetical protein
MCDKVRAWWSASSSSQRWGFQNGLLCAAQVAGACDAVCVLCCVCSAVLSCTCMVVSFKLETDESILVKKV